MEIEGMHEVKAMEQIVSVVTYFHDVLDQKTEDLRDCLEKIQIFYNDMSKVEIEITDLDGNIKKIKVLKPLAVTQQTYFDTQYLELATQMSSCYQVSLTMKEKLYTLSTNRIQANQGVEQVKPVDPNSLGEKIKSIPKAFSQKQEKQYTSLNELDDPFKLSMNVIQEQENYIKIFDKWTEWHQYCVGAVEETPESGQLDLLRLAVNYFKARVLPLILRVIEESNRLQREAERNEAVKVMIQAKAEADRARNSGMGMMMPQPTN